MADKTLPTIRTFQVFPDLPEALQPLLELAKNLWWVWHPDAVELFRRLDRQLWEQVHHNPVKLLGSIEQAKLLRARYKFAGEVRATGHVKQDQLYLMARVGIDAFDLSPTEKVEEAIATLDRFKIAYTPGAPLPSITRERFHA